MMVWRKYDEEFLQELLRHEGLGSDTPSCCTCSGGSQSPPSTPPSTPHPDNEGETTSTCDFIRCQDCCAGFVECVNCCAKRHQHLPFHRIEVCFVRFSTLIVADNFFHRAEVEWVVLGRNNAENYWPHIPAGTLR